MKRRSFARILCLTGILLGLLQFTTHEAQAASCQSNTNWGNWSSPSSWTGCNDDIPQSGDSVFIDQGDYIMLDVDPAAGITDITIDQGARIWLQSGSSRVISAPITVNLGGRLIAGRNGGSLTFTGSSLTNNGEVSGDITFGGTTQSISGTGDWQRFYEYNVGGWVDCFLIINSSTSLGDNTQLNNCDLSIESVGTLNTNSSTLTFSGNYYQISNYGTLSGSGAVHINGENSISQSGTFSAPLVIDNNITRIYGSNFSGDITVDDPSGTLLHPSGTLNFTGSSFTNNGFVGGSITFGGTTQSISGTGNWEYHYSGLSCHLRIDASSTTTLGSDINLDNCDLTINSGSTLSTATHELNFSSANHAITNSGSISGTGSINVQGDSDIIQNGASFSAPIWISYGNVEFSGSGAFAGNITNNGGTVTGSISSFTGDAFTNNGNFNGTVVFFGTSSQSVAAGSSSYWNNCYLAIGPSSTTVLESELTLNNCDFGVGGTFDTITNTLTLVGAEGYTTYIYNYSNISGTGSIRTQGSTNINNSGSFLAPLYIEYGSVLLSGGSFGSIENAGGSLTLNDDINISGDFVQNSSFTHNNHGLTFNGSGTQNLTLPTATTFYTITVNDGVTLVETESADNASIAAGGSLNTAGSGRIRKTVAIDAGSGYTYTFGLTDVQVYVNSISGTDPSIQVDRLEQNHPNATTGIQTGRNWDISALNASAFNINLTLPHTYSSDYGNTKICRYAGPTAPGGHWDCAGHARTATTVTRNEITSLSEWAVGYSVGPTAIVIKDISASPTGNFNLAIIMTAIIGILTASSWQLKQIRKLHKA